MMTAGPLRWLAHNVGALLLAFGLAIVVWVSAVNTSDPTEEHTLRPVALERVSQDVNLILTGKTPEDVSLNLRMPRSVWTQVLASPGVVHTWIDLSGLGPGEHSLPVKARIDLNPVRVMLVDPAEVKVVLETLSTKIIPITLTVTGDPALGYQKGAPTIDVVEARISGPQSAVTKVAQVRARIDINAASQTATTLAPLEVVDADGEPIVGVTITPRVISITQPISLLGGFKNVAVNVLTSGQAASGYRIASIYTVPPNVTISSTNPQLINEIPGFVETLPVSLNGLREDADIRVSLNLPRGVTLVGEQSVLVHVGIAAIEGSLTISVPVETHTLSPNLRATISPLTVDLIVSGPLPTLATLTPASFRAVVEVAGLTPGVYQLSVVIDLTPDQVRVEAVLPRTVEVTMMIAPTATLTPLFTLTPTRTSTPTRTPTPTPAPSRTPTP
jgi:YbbR domain-containing protein